MNQILPRKNAPGHSLLDQLIDKFGLKQDQARRQLTNWKNEKFEVNDNAFSRTPKELCDVIQDRISISPNKLFFDVLESMIPSLAKPTAHNSSRFALAQICVQISDKLSTLARYFKNPLSDHQPAIASLQEIFKSILTSYSRFISNNIPLNIKMISGSEFTFVLDRDLFVRQN